MSDMDTHKEKEMKRTDADSRNTDLRDLKQAIEEMRDKLNNMILQGRRVVINEEIIKISQQLDKLIAKYFEG